jgi:uncharacterized membrane protein YccC
MPLKLAIRQVVARGAQGACGRVRRHRVAGYWERPPASRRTRRLHFLWLALLATTGADLKEGVPIIRVRDRGWVTVNPG